MKTTRIAIWGLLLALLAFLPVTAAGLRVKSAEIRGSKIMVVFSEAVDASTLTDGSLSVLDESGRLARALHLSEEGRRLMIRLQPRHRFTLFRPLVLVMTPDVKARSGGALQRGFVKAFNLVELAAGRKRPLFQKRVVVVSEDPCIELEVLDLRVFWHKDRFRGKFHELDDDEERRDWREMEKGWDEEREEKEHRHGKFDSLEHSRLHPPVLNVSGVENGQTASQGVQITFTASDADNDLRMLQSLLDFREYASGASIEVSGAHWLFALAVDAWHLFDHRFLRFTVETSAPEFVSLTPSADFTTRDPNLIVQGEVSGATKVTINGVEVPLSGGKFQGSYILVPGANPFTVVAGNLAGQTVSRSFVATYVSDDELPRITITAPLNGSFFNIGSTLVAGTVADESAVTGVTVNGLPAVVSGAAFSLAALPLEEGVNTIVVQAVDEHGNTGTAQVTVTLDTVAPKVSVVTPSAGALVCQATLNVSGTIEDANPAAVSISGKAGQTAGGSFYFEGLALSEGENTLLIEAEDRAGNKGQQSLTVVLDTQPPQLAVTAPAEGAMLAVASVAVSGTVSDLHEPSVRVNGIPAVIAGGVYSALVPLGQGVNQISVVASDRTGNRATRTIAVTIDTLAPQVSVMAPTAGALLNARAVDVTGVVIDPHVAAVLVNGRQAVLDGQTFRLAALPLQEGANTIGIVASDLAGNSRSLSVSVVVDTEVPALKTVMPAAGTKGVDVGAAVEAEFSEAIVPVTLNDSSFYVSRENGDKVIGSLALDGAKVRFLPAAPLPDSSLLTVHINTTIRDEAGNALSAPYAGTFATVDLTPPAAPELQLLPESTNLKKVTVSGTAEANAAITISGGAAVAETVADAVGAFAAEVILNVNQLNQLMVYAGDAAGNQGLPAQAVIYQKSSEFGVLDAVFAGNRLTVSFTAAVDAATLTTDALRVSSLQGVETGSLSVSGSSVVFQPAADLSSTPFLLEVSTAVADSAGNRLVTPFARMFNQEGAQTIVQGEVYDDATGLPLPGARVTLIDINGSAPAAPVPTAMTTREGSYALLLPAEKCTLRVSREGYGYSDRVVQTLSGFSSAVFDSRLAPLDAAEHSLLPSGCAVAADVGGATVHLTLPPGAVGEEKRIRIGGVSAQALQGRLPSGWSPVAAFDLWPCGINFAAPATLVLPLAGAASLPAGTPLALVHWDARTFQWIVNAMVADGGALESVQAAISSTGQYALCIADSAPVVPGAPVVGAELPTAPAGSIPESVAAQLDFAPKAIYPGGTATGSLSIVPPAPVTSGVALQARVNERYELISGTTAAYAPYTADLTAYSYGGSQLRVDFNLSPNQEIAVGDLKLGHLETDLVRYAAGSLGVVIGSDGGSVSGEGGVEASIEAGALDQPLAVSLKKTAVESLPLGVPAGFRFLGAMEFSISGGTLKKSAVLSMALDAALLAELPSDAQLVVCRLAKIGDAFACVVSQTAFIEGSRIKSHADAQAPHPFSGVRQGGTYLFLQAQAPAGYFKGAVTDKGAPCADAVVTVNGHDLISLPQAGGAYAQISFLGERRLQARQRLTDDLGAASGTLSAAGEVQVRNIAILPTGPAVLSVSPANQAVTVPLDSAVDVIFSEAVRATTFTSANFYVSAGAVKLAGTYKLSIDARQGRFIPAQPLPSDAVIAVTVSAGIQDIHGNPMAQPFQSTFRTKDVVPPIFDVSRIRKLIPEGGFCTIEGGAGAVEPGALVIVINDRTGEAVTASGLSDGSFSLNIAATFADVLLITVKDLAGNEIAVDPGPFISRDGKSAVLGAEAASFVTRDEKLGLEVEAGTFGGSVLVRVEAETDARNLAVPPSDFSRLGAVKVDFNGVVPARSYRVSIPAPANLPADASFFVAHEVTVFGERKVMIVDTCTLKEGRITVNSPPWPGIQRTESAVLSILMTTMSWSLVTGYAPSSSAMVAAADLAYLCESWSTPSFVFPVRVGSDFTLTVRDLDTGETLFSGIRTASSVAGQVYELTENLSTDAESPRLLSASGFDVSSFQWTGAAVTMGKVRVEKIGGQCVITGEAGAVSGGNMVWTTLFHVDPATGLSTVSHSEAKAGDDGGFTLQPAREPALGDEVLFGMERDDVAFDRPFVLNFSEGLKAVGDLSDRFRLAEKESGKITACDAVLEPNGTTVTLTPKQSLVEDMHYKLVITDLRDRSNNALNLTLYAHTRRVDLLDLAETGDVYESLLCGRYLYVAAGDNGLNIVDVANPGQMVTVGAYTAFSEVRSLALYKAADNQTYVLMTGGGSQTQGYLKWIEVSDPANPHQVKSQIVSGMVGGGAAFGLGAGYPRRVKVVGDTAFVAVHGYGLIVVDLTKMTAASNSDCLVGRFDEEWTNDVEVFVDEVKGEDGTVSQAVRAMILIDYFGVKLLNVTVPAQIKLEASFEVPSRSHVQGLEVVRDYEYDKDSDGRIEAGEKGDFAFFTLPDSRELYIMDISKRSYLEKVGSVIFTDAGGLGDIFFSRAGGKIYVCDINQGVYLVDMRNPSGFGVDRNLDGIDDRIVATIATQGRARFGLAVDENNQIFYVGDQNRGIESQKLANPRVRIVVRNGEGNYVEPELLQPYGLEKETDYAAYPSNREIYVMACLPQAANEAEGSGEAKAFAELWSLNAAGAAMVPWWQEGAGAVPTQLAGGRVPLKRLNASARFGDPDYGLFISPAVRLTVDPKDENGAALKLLSGDLVRANLSADLRDVLSYLTEEDLRQSFIEVGSIRADWVDSATPEPANNPSTGSGETSFAGPGLMDVPACSGAYLHSGEFFIDETDLRIPGRGFDFEFTRRYESRSVYSGPLGWNWEHSYNRRLLELPNGDILYFDGSGRRERYIAQKSGTVITGYKSPTGAFTELKKRSDGTFTLVNSDRFVEIFDPAGRLSRLQDRNANKMEFYYDFAGQLSAVLDTMGRLITFEYYPVQLAADGLKLNSESGRLQSITDFTGRQVVYEYDDKGDLIKATLGERDKEYAYTSDSDLEKGHNLASIKDPNGQVYLQLTYNGDDMLTAEKIGNASVTINAGSSASTTDGNGHSRSYTHNDKGNPLSVTEGGNQTTFVCNTDGLVTEVKYPEGNSIQYAYDSGNVAKRSQCNMLTMTENPGAKGADEGSRVTTFAYDNNTNQVIKLKLPNSLEADHTLDGNGNIKTVTTNMPGVSFAYEYNAYGQLAAETDPMQNRTVYAYHPETAPGGSSSEASGRALDPSTGGYLKQAASTMTSRQFDQYDAAGNLQLFSDSSGTNASYTLDNFNQVKNENIMAAGSLSPMQLQADHDYDGNGNEKSKTEKWGAISNAYTSTYDIKNNLKTFTETGLGTTNYGYDNNDNVTSIDDASGRRTSFEYNNRNLIRSLTSGAEAGAGTSQFDYDGNGNLTQITDPMNKTTIMAYDGFDRVRSVKDPLGNETVISRANMGNMLTIKRLDSAGNLLRQSTTLNDPLGRMLSRSDKLLETGDDVTFQYGYTNLPDGGQEITITDPLGRVSKVSKDKEGKVFKEEDAAGNTVDYFYEDGRGNMTKKVENEKNGGSYATQYVYNAFNKIEKLTENAGTPQEAITKFFYDSKGNLTGSVDAEGHTISHEYDTNGRKTKTTRELENGTKLVTQFGYDTNNNLVSIKDANNNETKYEYDTVNKRNWLTKITYPDSTTIEYTKYDLNGNVITEKQRNGTIVTNTYNALNLLTNRVINPAAGVLDTTGETYEYDGASRLTKATDNDSTVEFDYDSLNRKISETQNNKLIKYTYDKVNNLTSIQYPNQRIIEREFDVLNRISKIKQGGTDIANMAFIGRTYRMLSKGYQNGDVIKYLYDAGRRNTGIEAKNLNQQIINQYAYGYNKINLKNYEQRVHDANKGDIYAYDAVNRIKNVKFDAPDPTDPQTAQFAKAKTYNLDKVDNILKIVENKNNVDAEILSEMTGNNLQLNQYTKFDKWTMAYDANGNTTQKGTQQFSYNYRNQLVRATADANTFTLKYDPFGRRIEKSGAGNTTRFYYAGNQVIEERNGSDAVLKQYFWGNGIDELLRMDKYAGNTPTPYYFHTNDIGSTTAITDSTGALVERVSYDTFGIPSFTDAAGQPIASSSIGNTTLFQGREFDTELNLYNYRARFYDPAMGRFLQNDPVGYQDSLNLYQSFGNNPVNFTDPMGKFFIPDGKIWEKGSAYVIAEEGDNQNKLSMLITGLPGGETEYAVGQEINVTPFILVFESIVRKNIAKAAPMIRASFQTSMSSGHPFENLSENQINSWFRSTNKRKIECFGAASVIMSKGLIDSLQGGEFDQLGFTSTTVPTTYRTNVDLKDIKTGDWTTFRNDTRYRDYWYNSEIRKNNKVNPEDAPYQYENVIKTGNDSFFGFPAAKAKSLQQWRITLAEEFNSCAPNNCQINMSNIPFHIGYVKQTCPVISLDFFTIAQKIFLLRNRK